MLSFKGLIKELEKERLVERIRRRVSSEFEVAYYLKRFDGVKAVIFDDVEGKGIPVVGNLITNRKVLYKILNVKSEQEAYLRLLSSIREPKDTVLTDRPRLKSLGDDLGKLPVLKYYEKDGGPYITSAIVAAKEPDGDVCNSSIHRMMVISDTKLAVRIVPRHLYKMYNRAKDMGKELDVVVVIGSSPYFYVASSSSPPYGVYELNVANALSGGTLKSFILDERTPPIPCDSEIIIRGRLLSEEAFEGPFTDITGTYDVVRKQPILEVDEILTTYDPIYYAILPAGLEHMTLMGFPREASMWEGVSKVVPSVNSVRLTRGGCGWLTAVISIRKQTEGDGKNAIIAAFASHPSLKIVIVVDDDIDVDNMDDVLWALSTRMQPSDDIVVIRNVRGSSLDPSSDQQRLLTSKLGIDATIPLYRSRKDFEKAKIPWSEERANP